MLLLTVQPRHQEEQSGDDLQFPDAAKAVGACLDSTLGIARKNNKQTMVIPAVATSFAEKRGVGFGAAQQKLDVLMSVPRAGTMKSRDNAR